MGNSTRNKKKCDKVDSTGVINYWALESDESLIKNALAGEDRAFEFLFNRYRKQILSKCLKMTQGDHAQALDLCQETFISAFDHLAELREPSKFFYWVTGIAKNKCISYKNQTVRNLNMLGDYSVLNESINDKDERWTDAELKLVEDLVNGIEKPSLRDTIRLYYIEGNNSAEIARIQGISQTTVTTRLNRFRVKFKSRIVREALKLSK
ncbi:MAG: RNA polymerase sigma factor [Gammaproteobacteria bacterium]